jgi:hypothetical protein
MRMSALAFPCQCHSTNAPLLLLEGSAGTVKQAMLSAVSQKCAVSLSLQWASDSMRIALPPIVCFHIVPTLSAESSRYSW